MADVEKEPGTHIAFACSTIHTLEFRDVNVSVIDRKSKAEKALLEDINGSVQSGEMLAVMGPSGSGKTTLLNVLARRTAAASAKVDGVITIDGHCFSATTFRHISSYVEQEDTLIGSLTVKESLDFAARLSLKRTVSKEERQRRVTMLIKSFGLSEQADTLIGTPVRKGISGGQKRRLSIALQLITGPRILFLDEPTSGLDSVASHEVMAFLRSITKKLNLIVIANIHQPTTAIYGMFDKLLLLSRGRTAFCGHIDDVAPHFSTLDLPINPYMNPAEFLLDMVSTDFAQDVSAKETQLEAILHSWNDAKNINPRERSVPTSSINDSQHSFIHFTQTRSPTDFGITVTTLLHRSFVKSYRDVLAYGIRLAMYLGLAIMMGTVWLRLQPHQDSIQSFINAIFFGGAFMSFMAVAYIPAFLEDRAVFVKERANGLYGPAAFMLANFLVGVPFIFVIDVLFSVVVYWLSGYQPTARAFFTWIMWLFLDLLAAESLVVLISSLLPIFVVALAITAFANGLWMSVGGFLVPTHILNPFWRYVFHYIDYQAYVFQGMMVNEFADRTYTCGDGCHCMYETELASQCLIKGTGVLETYGFRLGRTGEWVGILCAIIVVYRALGLAALWMRKT